MLILYFLYRTGVFHFVKYLSPQCQHSPDKSGSYCHCGERGMGRSRYQKLTVLSQIYLAECWHCGERGMGTIPLPKVDSTYQINLARTVIAERGGFEPPMGLLPCHLSKVVHSTALPSLHMYQYISQLTAPPKQLLRLS
jgi:hypothetical protein